MISNKSGQHSLFTMENLAFCFCCSLSLVDNQVASILFHGTVPCLPALITRLSANITTRAHIPGYLKKGQSTKPQSYALFCFPSGLPSDPGSVESGRTSCIYLHLSIRAISLGKWEVWASIPAPVR